MSSFALPGATRRGESVGERKDVWSDQKVLILGSDRMPIHTVCGDGDFRYEICARKGDALRCKTPEGDSADHPVLFADLSTVQELAELGRFGVRRDRCGQSHAKSLRLRPLNALPRFGPSTCSTMMIVALGRWAVEAYLQCHPIARQRPQNFQASPDKKHSVS